MPRPPADPEPPVPRSRLGRQRRPRRSSGRSGAGSIVWVSSYRSTLARTGSFISANTSETFRAFSHSSSSSSMSAAVVSTSVIGSAATTIHRRSGVAFPHDRRHLLAERAAVREDQRRVEPVQHETREGLRTLGVLPGTSWTRASPSTLPSRVWYGHQDQPEDVQDREHDGDEDTRGDTRTGPPRERAAIESQNSVRRCRQSRTVAGMSASEIDAAITTAASVGCGRLRSRSGASNEQQHDRDRTDHARELALRTGLLGHRGWGTARAHGEPLEEPGRDVRHADADHLLAPVHVVAPPGGEPPTRSRSCRRAPPSAMPKAPPTSSGMSERRCRGW